MSYLFCFCHTVIISQNQYVKPYRNHSFRLSNAFLPFLKNNVGITCLKVYNQTSDVNAEIDMEAVPIVVIGAE